MYIKTAISDKDYIKGKLVGHGVYGNIHEWKDGKVAKVMSFINKKTDTFDWSFYETMINEINILHELHGIPNVSQVEEVIITPESVVYIMKHLGDNLANIIPKIKSIENKIDTIKKVTTAISRAMIYMNRKFIHHCDIKPHNIMIKNEDINLIDFSISKFALGPFNDKDHTTIQTVWYRAPEEFVGSNVEKNLPKTDVWSLGIVVLDILASRLGSNGSVVESGQVRKFIDLIGLKDPPTSHHSGLLSLGINPIVDRESKIDKLLNEYSSIENFSEFCDLVKGMLTWNHEDRLSFEDIYNHPFLNNDQIEKISLLDKLTELNFPQPTTDLIKKYNMWYLNIREKLIRYMKNHVYTLSLKRECMSYFIRAMDYIMSINRYSESFLTLIIRHTLINICKTHDVNMISDGIVNMIGRELSEKFGLKVQIMDDEAYINLSHIVNMYMNYRSNILSGIVFALLIGDSMKLKQIVKSYQRVYLHFQSSNQTIDESDIVIAKCIMYILDDGGKLGNKTITEFYSDIDDEWKAWAKDSFSKIRSIEEF